MEQTNKSIISERVLRRTLFAIAVFGLAIGILAHIIDLPDVGDTVWTLATVPVIIGLAVSIARDRSELQIPSTCCSGSRPRSARASRHPSEFSPTSVQPLSR